MIWLAHVTFSLLILDTVTKFFMCPETAAKFHTSLCHVATALGPIADGAENKCADGAECQDLQEGRSSTLQCKNEPVAAWKLLDTQQRHRQACKDMCPLSSGCLFYLSRPWVGSSRTAPVRQGSR